MIKIIDKILIIYTCVMFYFAGLFIDETYYTQYYITTFHVVLIFDLVFTNVISRTLLIVPTPATIILNFTVGDISYLCIITMIVSSNVFCYTIYKIIKKRQMRGNEPLLNIT